MKKHLTTLYLFAATMLVATTLTGCGEAVDIDSPAVETGKTEFVFEANADGTRTSMNADRYYYWEPGDKIWVKTGSSSYAMSKQSTITASRQATARFIVDEDLSGSNNYPVVYTGYTGTVGKDTASTVATSVTIAAAQTQSDWNKSEHLAVSGDCGTGTAIKQANGQYKFTLFHQAHYLVLYPYLGSTMTGNYTLQKVEIISDNNLAGNYDIDATTTLGALADYPAAGTGSSMVTLTCNGGFLLSRDIPNLAATPISSNYLVAVIHPNVHTLTIKYTVVNSSNEPFTFIQDIDAAQYPYGSVTPLPFELANAVSGEVIVVPSSNLIEWRWGASTVDGANSTSINPLTNGFWANCPGSPNNAYWYFSAGGYWDNSQQWRYSDQETIQRGGVWMKKSTAISGFGGTPYPSTPLFTPVIGRPDASVIGQYFFLPAFRGLNSETYYWTKRPHDENYAYVVEITKGRVGLGIYSKGNKFIAYHRGNNIPWFQ